MEALILIICVVLGYIAGSIPTGYWLGKMKGIDLTKVGSGGTGATNVLRNLGKGPAIATLIIDVLKGLLPVYFSLKYTGCHLVGVLVAASAILGHSKSIFLKFKGGKSSATGLGVFLALSWKPALFCFIIWIIVVVTSRISSLGSIVALPILPIVLIINKEPMSYIVFASIAATYIVFIKHKENIKRLIAGTEPKIGEKKTEKK